MVRGVWGVAVLVSVCVGVVGCGSDADKDPGRFVETVKAAHEVSVASGKVEDFVWSTASVNQINTKMGLGTSSPVRFAEYEHNKRACFVTPQDTYLVFLFVPGVGGSTSSGFQVFVGDGGCSAVEGDAVAVGRAGVGEPGEWVRGGEVMGDVVPNIAYDPDPGFTGSDVEGGSGSAR